MDGFADQAIGRLAGRLTARRRCPAARLAHAVVALYLGLEMLSHLDGDRTPALALFAQARQLAALFDGIGMMPGPAPEPNRAPGGDRRQADRDGPSILSLSYGTAGPDDQCAVHRDRLAGDDPASMSSPERSATRAGPSPTPW